MSRAYADFQGEDITARELDLEQRLRAGDPQVADELPAFLQSRFLRRAYQYLRDYRHVLPAYLEAVDLVQEAYLVLVKRLEESRSKDSPLGYLITAGYQAMRCLCLSLVHDPRTCSLDQPCFSDDETPLHEYLPTSMLPASPYAQEEDMSRYEALYEAIARLPDQQRMVIEEAYGIHEHAASQNHEIEQKLGWSRGRVTYRKYRTLTTLALALREAYPDYAQPARLACIPEAQWQRMDEAYARLQAQNCSISTMSLAREARVGSWAAIAYLQIQEGKPRPSRHEQVQRKLDQAYAALQARGKPITVRALYRETGSKWELIRDYLRKRNGVGVDNAHH